MIIDRAALSLPVPRGTSFVAERILGDIIPLIGGWKTGSKDLPLLSLPSVFQTARPTTRHEGKKGRESLFLIL